MDGAPDREQKQIYADYAALNQAPGVTPGPPLGLPQDARTVRVVDGRTSTTDGTTSPVTARSVAFWCSKPTTSTRPSSSRLHPAARHGGAIEVLLVATYW